MIPKVIHYCWFGRGEKPKLAKKCIASWKKFMPDYRIVEWNEDNFDIGMNPYTQMCYNTKKYAFLSDYVRLAVIEAYGGIYFDTDVEVLKSFDPLIQLPAFFGFETNEFVQTGLGFGAEPHHITVCKMIEEYEPLLDGKHGTVGCPKLNTQALIPLGLKQNGELQTVAGAFILPSDYLNPYDDPTGVLTKTDNTYSIHWYGKSWMTKRKVLRSKITRQFHRFFGTDCFERLKR